MERRIATRSPGRSWANADQQLRPHFHLHGLVASGALSDDGSRWIAGGAKMMFPVQARKFYSNLDTQVAVHRVNPDRVWDEWQVIRQVK